MPPELSNQTPLTLRRPEVDAPVRPVPEHRADAELAPIYRDLKQTLGVPWVGVITQAVAYYRPFFIEAWHQFQPSARSHYFESRCNDIRLTAWEQVGTAFEIAPQIEPLHRLGYSDAEIAQIRAMLDVFDYGNPKYFVLATAIQQSLYEGRRLGGQAGRQPWDDMPRTPLRPTDSIPVMVEEHHSLGSLQCLYDDIKTTLTLPFVNSDYKAMARWPSYLELAWHELKPSIDSPPYVRIRQSLHDQAIAAAQGLPHEYCMDKAHALSAGLSEDAVRELMDVISLFQWLLSGLILNVTYFKLALTDRS